MGNKNARKRPVAPLAKAKNLIDSVQSSGISPETASMQPAKLATEALAGVKQATLSLDLNKTPSGNKEGEGRKLNFKSYQTGTYITNNFLPYGSIKVNSSGPSNKKALSAQSAAFVPSSCTIVPNGPPHQYLTRKDPEMKDVIITASSIVRNIARVTEQYLPNGQLHRTMGNEFMPENYNVVTAIKNMPEAKKQDFWENNWVQIDINLREPAVDKGTVIDQLNKLGPDFALYTKTVYVYILFANPGPSSDLPSYANLENRNGRWVYPDSSQILHTRAFDLLTQLAQKLNTFHNLQKLEVCLRNPKATTTTPITLQQLYHGLPFYDLNFEDWTLKWQATHMSRPESVSHFCIILLDKERNKVVRARDRAEKAAAKKKQQEIDNQTHITYSVAPEPVARRRQQLPKCQWVCERDTLLRCSGCGQHFTRIALQLDSAARGQPFWIVQMDSTIEP